MTILVLTRYWRLGSSSRVRFYQYFPYLKARGIELITAPFFDDEYIRSLYTGRRISPYAVLHAYLRRLAALTRRRDIALIWAEKEFLPWLPFEVEKLLLPRRVPCMVDYDDAVFHRYDMHPNRLVRKWLGQKIDRVMRHADLVVAGNDYLAERAERSGARRIEILPSVVDVSQYQIKRPEEDAVFKIGWIGAPVTAKYLNGLQGVLSELSRMFPVRLVLVGGNAPPFPDVPTELIPWSEEIERTVNQKFDVGIMPLVDDPFERGKCGYKLIQYMAGGIPVVASPVGVNRKIVEPGVHGYLANSPSEWLTALCNLRENPQMRIEMGNAGRRKAETLYNLQVTAPQLLELLKSAAH
jgi:glycosyltransferase involved in cell wall biosynthesis